MSQNNLGNLAQEDADAISVILGENEKIKQRQGGEVRLVHGRSNENQKHGEGDSDSNDSRPPMPKHNKNIRNTDQIQLERLQSGSLPTDVNIYDRNQFQLAKGYSMSLDHQLQLQSKLDLEKLRNEQLGTDRRLEKVETAIKANNIDLLSKEQIIHQYNKKMACVGVLGILLLVYFIAIVYLFIQMGQLASDCKCTNDSSSTAAAAATTDTTNTAAVYTTLTPTEPPTIKTNPNAGTDTTTNTPTKAPSVAPTESPTVRPSTDPSSHPSAGPTEHPTEDPTGRPSVDATYSPTMMPTVYDGWNVGDFKISVLDESHDYWLLCDGSYYDKRLYDLLFDTIRYTFGSSGLSEYLFALPNVTDRVIGFAAGNGEADGRYAVGDYIGSYSNSLTEDNIPDHFHYVMSGTTCDTSYAGTYDYLAYFCNSNLAISGTYYYQIAGESSTVPNKGKSSSVGSGTPFNVEQETAIIGHVFIYAGQVLDL